MVSGFGRAAAICVMMALALASAAAPGPRGAEAAKLAGATANVQLGEGEIRGVLERQVVAWNRGDIESFMLGYRKSDDTEFVGANGITRGWQAVLERYKKSYPDGKAMGHLSFSNLEIHMTCDDAAFVIGQFQLERENDRPAGVFTLNFKRFAEGWRIVADHTTAFAAATTKTN
jgi:hypothetical protein